MAEHLNLNNNKISKELLVNKLKLILDNQCRLMLNEKKINLPDEPHKSHWFVQKRPPEVFCKRRFFGNFTEKLLCCSLFLIKMQAQACKLIKKRLQH